MLGRPDIAASGKLRTFLCGPESAVERWRSVVQGYTLKGGILEVGEDCTHANVLKLSANYALVTCISFWANSHSENLRIRNYKNEDVFALRGGLKDINMMISAGEEVGVLLPYANAIHNHIITDLAHGHENKDWAVRAESARLASRIKEEKTVNEKEM
ncbi:unnamed protein product [Didymodactylos carnosus]|uniref:Uncharacterized protein n=1 Tax=Didymodactylos carnosus TaxID=1234261 RepID=A0A8S2NAY2_9BILA|nr:unnamed protein product [Didymodactylos carnosus]CAF3997654.1 unnamed protein product [Didymodactylos carnosus]